MTLIPYNFEDDVHYNYNKSFDISLLEEFKTSEYLIMDFHPIHIFLNSDCVAIHLSTKSWLCGHTSSSFE